MRFDFFPDADAVVISDEGRLTGERFGLWLRELTVEPDFTLEMHQIFDLRAMTGLPSTPAELEAFLRVGAGFNRGSGRVAVVAPDRLGPDLAEMLETRTPEDLGREMGVFETVEAALAWVKTGGPPTP